MTSAIVGSASLHATKKTTASRFSATLLPKYNVFKGDRFQTLLRLLDEAGSERAKSADSSSG
jgi:hypothetical protein